MRSGGGRCVGVPEKVATMMKPAMMAVVATASAAYDAGDVGPAHGDHLSVRSGGKVRIISEGRQRIEQNQEQEKDPFIYFHIFDLNRSDTPIIAGAGGIYLNRRLILAECFRTGFFLRTPMDSAF